MKIVYLNGPYRKLSYSRSSRSPAVTKSGTLYYPLWLAYAAGLARSETDHDIELIDAVVRKWDSAELVAAMAADPPDLVVCETSTPSIYDDIETAGVIKQAFENCRVILVGTHATALPEEVLQSDQRIDGVARGEFDETIIALAHVMDRGGSWSTVEGLSYRQGDRVIHNPDRPLIDDLDRFPFISEVYRDGLNVRDYFFSAAQYPMVMIITSRGCPHRCKWCLYPQVMHRGKYRLRSSESVAAEFAFIAREMPEVREVGIEDDLFTGNKKRLHEICELLIKQKNRLNFWCDTRVDLDYETMRLMKAAGCRLLIAGFESGDQEVLDRINKGTQKDQSYEFMRNARKARLLVHGCFVLGNPGETHATMRKTLDFAKQLQPDTAQFFPMIVYPGTAMHQWARDEHLINSTDFNDWLTPDGLHNSVVDQPGLSGQEVVQFCNTARREFYLRRSYIVKKMGQSIVNIHEARRNVKAFCRVARHLVRSS
ncbi:MAG: B12-binding domain-containing radical SAM protein [Phycisphaerae bacterium]|nr:B12-binding domain-containing radical SAM protein [Phycisphaerae bacterium]